MAKFHFVEDYEKHVDDLIRRYPIDEAMSRAVGGDYARIGELELDILRHGGLKDDMAIFDLGCGSGRLAYALGKSGIHVDYVGTDIVQALLDYAKTRSPSHYRFLRHANLSVPVENSSLDIACAFSVFTHLLHHETYLYLEDMHRALKPGGRVIFSFLEFAEPGHWNVFEYTVNHQRKGIPIPLNSFVDRGVIELWCSKLGFEVVEFIEGSRAIGDSAPLGQATAILSRH